MYRVTIHVTVSQGDTVFAVIDRSIQVPTAEAVNDALPFGLASIPEDMDEWIEHPSFHPLPVRTPRNKPRRTSKKSRAHRNGWGGMSAKERKTEMARRRAVTAGDAPPVAKQRKTA